MDDDYFWEDLFRHLPRRTLVTVIGPDLGVVEGTDQTLTTLIGQRLAEKYDLDCSPGTTTMNEAVTAFVRKPGNRDVAFRLYGGIAEIIADLDPKPGEPLKNLAAISDLRLFVNTTPDQLLVQALKDTRSTSAIREITFSPSKSTEEQKQDALKAADTDTVVLNLFGQTTLPEYVIHEEDRLEWLHTLLSDAAKLPEWLDDRLRSQPMLFVGCEIPDSIGRFFLRMTSKKRLWSEDKQFFFVNAPGSNEPALSSFFTTYCRQARVQRLEMAPTEFVAELRERWDKLSPAKQSPAPSLPKPADLSAPDGPEIFISYIREDIEAAQRLKNAIAELGGDVWLDEGRIRPGDAWHDEILTAIHGKIRLFIAVVSANTEQEEEGYVFTEWIEAADRSRRIPRRRFFVPVTIDERYDPGSYENIPIEAKAAFKARDFGHAPFGDPDDNLRALLRDEIRNMRRPGAK